MILASVSFLIPSSGLTSTIIQQAVADGMSFESLPPTIIAGRPIALFIKAEPQILNEKTRGSESLFLRLFDTETNATIQHVTYFVHVFKENNELMALAFHSHSGSLQLNFHLKDGPATVLNGHLDKELSAWVSDDASMDGQFDVGGPIIHESGLYHFRITILGLMDDGNTLEEIERATFDSWLSMGESFHTRISYDNKEHDLVIISYYDKLNQFSYDPDTFTIFWTMPFDWDLKRILDPDNPIFVHQEVRVPRTLITFLNSTSFVATVNGSPLSGGVVVDPYSSETEYIVHYLVNKATLAHLAEIETQNVKDGAERNIALSFSLAISTEASNQKNTSTLIMTSSGIGIVLTWESGPLNSNQESRLGISFGEVQNTTSGSYYMPLNENVRYSISLSDQNGSTILARDDLIATNGYDFQTISFPANETYQLVVNLTGIGRQDLSFDESRNGVALSVVVVPEIASLAAFVFTASLISLTIFLGRTVKLKVRSE
jgi:hypothetical protein